MAKFTANKTEKKETTNAEPRVTRVTLYKSEKQPSLRGFVNLIYDGTVFMRGIAVRTNAEEDVYFTFPSKLRVKNGDPVLDNEGKKIYDDLYGPASKATREGVEAMIFEATQAKIAGNEPAKQEHGENSATVNLVEGTEHLVAMANIVYTGKFFMTNIAVHQSAKGDYYLTYPAKRRVNKNKEDILNEEGKPIYDNQFGPATKEDAVAMLELVKAAFEEKLKEQ